MTKDSNPHEQSRWSLNDLFPSNDSKELELAFSSLEELVARFESRRDELKDTLPSEIFIKIIRELEEITQLVQRIGGFAELWFT